MKINPWELSDMSCKNYMNFTYVAVKVGNVRSSLTYVAVTEGYVMSSLTYVAVMVGYVKSSLT